MLSGLDVRTSFRNLGLLHPFGAGTPKIHLAFSPRLNMPWTLEAAVCAISLVASFNPSGCARAGIAGLSAHRGGSASPWVESPSEAVLSVSSPFLKRGGRKNSCRPNSPDPKFSLPVSGLFLAVNEAQVGFLIKNDGIPAPLRERKNPTNASESVRSVVPGAALTKRPLALAFKIRFGRSLWKSLHRMADGWLSAWKMEKSGFGTSNTTCKWAF